MVHLQIAYAHTISYNGSAKTSTIIKIWECLFDDTHHEQIIWHLVLALSIVFASL